MYWKVRKETLFIIKPPYKMELGSDLGEHDPDTFLGYRKGEMPALLYVLDLL